MYVKTRDSEKRAVALARAQRLQEEERLANVPNEKQQSVIPPPHQHPASSHNDSTEPDAHSTAYIPTTTSVKHNIVSVTNPSKTTHKENDAIINRYPLNILPNRDVPAYRYSKKEKLKV